MKSRCGGQGRDQRPLVSGTGARQIRDPLLDTRRPCPLWPCPAALLIPPQGLAPAVPPGSASPEGLLGPTSGWGSCPEPPQSLSRLFAVTPTTRARTFSAACELPSPSWRFRPCSRLGPHGLGELVTPTGAGVGTGAPAPGLLGGQQGEVSVPPPAPALGSWSEFSSDKDPESLWLGQRGCVRGLFSVGTAVTTRQGSAAS